MMMKSIIFWIRPLCNIVTILVLVQLFLLLPTQILATDITMSEIKESKIVGGQPVSADNLYQWEVSIAQTKNIPLSASARAQMSSRQKESTHHCDGVLINPYWVLTAAHCVVDLKTLKVFDPPQSLQVGVGSKDLDAIFDRGRIPVNKIKIRNELYQPGVATSFGDIALIKLTTPAPSDLQFACISQNSISTYPGRLTSVGFGNTHALYYNISTNEIIGGIQPSRTLKETNVMDISEQADMNPKARYCIGRTDLICITAIMEPDSTCQGDSGGSLIYQNQVIGLTSFGDSQMKDKDRRVTCVGQTSYTRLSSHFSWIQSIIGNDFCSV